MAGSARKSRIVVLALVAALAAATGLALRATHALAWLQRPSVDARFSLRGGGSPPPRLLVVGLDNDSLAVLPRPPLPRRLYAEALLALHAAGARAIVLDVAFDRPSDPVDDRALLAAARRAAPVVFAASLIAAGGRTESLGDEPALAGSGDAVAASYLKVDPDGVIRRLLASFRGVPSIALATARALGRSTSAGAVEDAWIDWAGPPGTVREISLADLLAGRFSRALVRDSVVVIGATAPALQDIHSTAAGSPMTGPEVQANAIRTVLRGLPLRDAPSWLTTLLIVLLGAAVPLASLRVRASRAIVLTLILAGAWLLASQLLFDAGTVTELPDPLASLLLGGAAAVLFEIRAGERERERLRRLFAAGSEQLVESVLSGEERSLAPDAVIGGYRLERVVGRGGMGVVYRARQLSLERPVALKLISPACSEDPEFRERFERESRLAAAVDHPSVVPVFAAGQDQGLLFIAMRLVEGADLERLVQRSGPLPAERCVGLLGQIAGALDAAHGAGLVHRDVKPSNILVTFAAPEHAYLTDFGIAKFAAAATRTSAAAGGLGTAGYAAPEQVAGRDAGPAADVYALGAVAYFCLTGRPPFGRESLAATLWAQVHEAPPAACATRPELPAAVDGVLASALAKDPDARPRRASDLLAALAAALGVDSSLTAPRREDAPSPEGRSPQGQSTEQLADAYGETLPHGAGASDEIAT